MNRLLLLLILSTIGCHDLGCYTCQFRDGDIVQTRLGRKAMVSSVLGCASNTGDHQNCSYIITWEDNLGQPQWKHVDQNELMPDTVGLP